METILPREPGTSGLETHLGYWLRLVSNQVSGAFTRMLQERRVSVAEWVVLSHIHQRPEVKAGELAAALGLTRGAVSKVLDKVEAKNWIARFAMPSDNRAHLLSLTRKGRATLPELAEIADRNDEHFFACLNAGEKTELRRLLRKLADVHGIRNVPVE